MSRNDVNEILNTYNVLLLSILILFGEQYDTRDWECYSNDDASKR